MVLEGKVAFVTGAAGGIGREIAELFEREGARVAGFDRVSGEGVLQGDVRDPAEVERAMAQVGRIDVLVNSAGVREIGDVYTLPAEEWEHTIAVNLSGTFYCCQSAARRMRERGGGSIVNISSVTGLMAISSRPAYVASKHGIVGLTKALAGDLARDGIRVNAICPGVIRTALTERYFEDDSFERELGIFVPQGRVGTQAEVAQAALWLASDASSYVNGVALAVDGGWAAEKSYSTGLSAASTFTSPTAE